MGRLARVVLPNVPHHITQRGNRRLAVFHETADCERYIELLGHYARKFGLNIAGYCLMTNHIHVVADPQQEDSIARTFQHCHGLYAVEFNRKYIKSGHLWQGRPYSCVLDTVHSWAALRYVERNPVRAGMVARAEEYAWSSARAHCGESTDGLLTSDWPNKNAPADWSSWLVGTDEDQEQRIRQRSFTGRPCGDEQFTRYAESETRRSLTPGKRGPKPRAEPDSAANLLWTSDEIRS